MNFKIIWALGVMMSLMACGKDKAPSTVNAVLTGHVLDQDNLPVSGASLSLVTGGDAAATSDALGAYTITAPTPSDLNVVVAVQGAGFVKQTLRAQLHPTDTNLDTVVTLQKTGTTATVTLPAPGAAAASVATNGNDGFVQLSIPAQSLVNSDGVALTGDVNVALTYFHPRQRRSTLPLDLWAQDTNGTTLQELTTFGMADVEITQNGQAAQVGSGAFLGLTFQGIDSMRTYVADRQQEPAYLPRLYSASTSTGLWTEEGLLDSDLLSYDGNRNVFSAKLAHLSSWNIDSLNYGAGGCIQGAIVTSDASGASIAAATTPIRVWLASRDEVGFFDVTTDASGNYCIEPGVAHGAPTNTVRYFVSGQSNPNDTSMCNLLPTYCSTCVDTTIANDCQTCGLRDDQICSDSNTYGNWDIINNVDGPGGCSVRPSCGKDSSESDLKNNCMVHSGGALVPAYNDDCAADQQFFANLVSGAHCGGSSCFVAPTVNVGGTSTKQTTTSTTTTTTTTALPVCDPKNSHTKTYGQTCVPGVDSCCPLATLVCSDYVCVPKE